MKPLRIVVATHGHCFDGMASAALFTHVMRAVHPGADLSFRYRSCGYGPQMRQVPSGWLDGDRNAILDFRHTESERLDWYFDHHITAFPSEEARDTALEKATDRLGAPLPEDPANDAKAAPGGHRVYYEPTYGSCTKLIADVARERLAVSSEPLDELVRWADIIDAARFETAAQAIDDAEPILQLAAVVEAHGDGPFLEAMVPALLDKSVSQIAASDDVQKRWKPIATARKGFIERLKSRGERVGRAVFFDLSDAPLEVAAKFYAYALFPESVYSVTLLRTKQQLKVSVGYNPWCGAVRDRDIASICARYGGGGHAVVGAAAFPLAELERAKEIARSIAVELST